MSRAHVSQHFSRVSWVRIRLVLGQVCSMRMTYYYHARLTRMHYIKSSILHCVTLLYVALCYRFVCVQHCIALRNGKLRCSTLRYVTCCWKSGFRYQWKEIHSSHSLNLVLSSDTTYKAQGCFIVHIVDINQLVKTNLLETLKIVKFRPLL